MTRRAASSLAGVLELVEKHGSVVLSSRAFEGLAGADARAALHLAGVVTAAPAAASWPCDVRGCSREVRANHDGARKPLVAVCSQSPAACAPVELGWGDVAQVEIGVDALVAAACALLGGEADRAALAKLRQRRAIGDARMPDLVATADDPPRDVFWCGAPRDADLASFCARRERVSRGSLVLVPTMKHVAADTALRFAPGEHVEVRALADAVAVEGGKLALALGDVRGDAKRARAESAPATAPNNVTPIAPGVAALLGATRWDEIRLVVLDGTTLRIEAKGKSLLRSFVELGFVDGRKTEVVTPILSWSLLLLFCRKGTIKPSEYGQVGKPYGAKKAIEVLNKKMREAFGLEDNPIRMYSMRKAQWTAKFRVAAST